MSSPRTTSFGSPRAEVCIAGSAFRRLQSPIEALAFRRGSFILVECDRAFHRARVLGELSSERFAMLRGELRHLAEGWVLLRLSHEIVERSRGDFPEGPIRTLDALHLASVLNTAALIPETSLLSHDERVPSLPT